MQIITQGIGANPGSLLPFFTLGLGVGIPVAAPTRPVSFLIHEYDRTRIPLAAAEGLHRYLVKQAAKLSMQANAEEEDLREREESIRQAALIADTAALGSYHVAMMDILRQREELTKQRIAIQRLRTKVSRARMDDARKTKQVQKPKKKRRN